MTGTISRIMQTLRHSTAIAVLLVAGGAATESFAADTHPDAGMVAADTLRQQAGSDTSMAGIPIPSDPNSQISTFLIPMGSTRYTTVASNGTRGEMTVDRTADRVLFDTGHARFALSYPNNLANLVYVVTPDLNRYPAFIYPTRAGVEIRTQDGKRIDIGRSANGTGVALKITGIPQLDGFNLVLTPKDPHRAIPL